MDSNENSPSSSPAKEVRTQAPADVGVVYSRRESMDGRQQQALVYSGLLFMLISMGGFAGIVWWLMRIGAI